MTDTDWNKRIGEAIKRCHDWGREEYLDIIDDVVGGMDADSIAKWHKISPKTLAGALAHISASVHGPRPVPPLADGGWYEAHEGTYKVAPDFAAAWLAVRPKKGSA